MMNNRESAEEWARYRKGRSLGRNRAQSKIRENSLSKTLGDFLCGPNVIRQAQRGSEPMIKHVLHTGCDVFPVKDIGLLEAAE